MQGKSVGRVGTVGSYTMESRDGASVGVWRGRWN